MQIEFSILEVCVIVLAIYSIVKIVLREMTFRGRVRDLRNITPEKAETHNYHRHRSHMARRDENTRSSSCCICNCTHNSSQFSRSYTARLC